MPRSLTSCSALTTFASQPPRNPTESSTAPKSTRSTRIGDRLCWETTWPWSNSQSPSPSPVMCIHYVYTTNQSRFNQIWQAAIIKKKKFQMPFLRSVWHLPPNPFTPEILFTSVDGESLQMVLYKLIVFIYYKILEIDFKIDERQQLPLAFPQFFAKSTWLESPTRSASLLTAFSQSEIATCASPPSVERALATWDTTNYLIILIIFVQKHFQLKRIVNI